jgi:hypothetical protein
MDAERNRDALTDAALDRDLQALLAVEPSPEFLAQVRTRIASEPEPRAWWLSWKRAGAVAAAAIVAIAVYLGGPRAQPPVMQTPPLAARVLPNVAVDAGRPSQDRQRHASGVERPVQLEADSGDVVRRGQIRQADASAGQPLRGRMDTAALIDPREAAALRALIAGVRSGEVDLEPVLRASAPSAMDLPPVADIVIAPIAIAPLVEEGARQ